jgi:HK97 family phage major capsid protein
MPTAYWVNGDTGLKQTTDVAWANKYLNAEELAVIVAIPEAVLDDAGFDIWGEVKPKLVEAFGKKIDAAALVGTDKPSSWPDAILTDCASASQTLSLASVADIADAIGGESGIMGMIEADGFDVSGFVGHPTVKAKLRGVRDANGGLIYQPSMTAGTPNMLYGQPIEYPKNNSFATTSALMFAGDWSQSMVAIRQDITYKILTEAVITDAEGAVIYNLAQQDMVALRAVMRVAWQVANPITNLQETEASRYPFAALLV